MLKSQLEDPNARIIITTIQKLATFVKANRQHPVYGQHVVIIFDEAHRSQFGDMHRDIKRSFKRYNLFGFTGTPIFTANSSSSGNPRFRTTEQAFGDRLHTYTIVDAITDKNVLPFRVDYINTVRSNVKIDKDVYGIETEEALLAPERIRQVVEYVLTHYDQKTKRSQSYSHSVVTNVAAAARVRGAVEVERASKSVRGFNAIFATASIDAARRYYAEFARQQEEVDASQQLKIAMIYSFGANDPDETGILDDEGFDTSALSGDARTHLESVIQDYNEMFGTSYDTSSDSFQNYYKDLSQRLKNREVDLVIVVNMFLTGFDATTLNTLFVDKRLRSHGLIQAYSRTNRILNSVKTYGNIVSFRNLSEETDAALELFGNKDARGVVLLKPYAEYFAQYQAKVGELLATYSAGELPVGEEAQREFVRLFGEVLRLENILQAFDEFAMQQQLTERQKADYKSVYLELHRQMRDEATVDREKIVDDLVFEIELVKQVAVNVDYILMLVARHKEEHGDGDDVELRAEVSRAIGANPELRNKRDLIEGFVDTVSLGDDVAREFEAYVLARRDEELEALIASFRLRPEAARRFVDAALLTGEMRMLGTEIGRVLPPVSRFNRSESVKADEERAKAALLEFFDRYYGLGAAPEE